MTWRPDIPFSKWLHYFTFPTRVWKSSNLSTFRPTLLSCGLLLGIPMRAAGCYCVWDLHLFMLGGWSLMTKIVHSAMPPRYKVSSKCDAWPCYIISYFYDKCPANSDCQLQSRIIREASLHWGIARADWPVGVSTGSRLACQFLWEGTAHCGQHYHRVLCCLRKLVRNEGIKESASMVAMVSTLTPLSSLEFVTSLPSSLS